MRVRSLPIKLILYAILIIITIATLVPFLWAFASSFSTDSEIFKSVSPLSWKAFIPFNFNMTSYTGLFKDYNFGIPIKNTLVVSALTIVFGCIVNSVAAFGFATFEFKGKKVLYAIVLLSFMIPFESIAMPLYKVVSGFGWVDTYNGIIIPTLADGLVLMLFTQFFKEIPVSLTEAARVDGANFPTIFTKIIVPLSVPVFVTAGLMVFMNSWNAFLWPLIIAKTPESRMIQVALAAFQTERDTLWSYLFAASTISVMIPLCLFLPLQRFYIEGVTSSGIKG